MKINTTLIANLYDNFLSIFREKAHPEIPDGWKDFVMQKIYSLFVTFGLFVFVVGMIAAYQESLYDLMIFLTIVYLSGAVIFITKWSNDQLSVNLLIFYLYLTGNGLMYYCTDELFGIFWLFIAPIILSVFNGKFKGLVGLMASLFMVVFWGALGTLDYLKWDLGAPGSPVASWLAIVFIFVLTSMAVIVTCTSLIEAYGESMLEKQIEKDELRNEKEKLVHANNLLELEIENNAKLQAEKASSENKFITLFDTAQDMYVLHNGQGRIVDVNKETIDKLGYSKADFIDEKGRAAKLANISLTPDQIYLLGDKTSQITEGNVFDFEGKPIPVEFNNKLMNLGGENHILSIIRDISHRKEAEKEIEQINKQLQIKVLERTAQFDDAMQELRQEIKQRLNTENELRKTKKILETNLQEEKKLSEMKTRFVSMISHEYRTPLTIIYTCTDILDFVFKQGDKAMFDKNINRIKRSVNAMINLLEDVLVIGRSEVRNIETTPVQFELTSVLRETVEELSITDNYEHEIKLAFQHEPFEISSDMKLVQYIIRNFITNAQKYSPSGSDIMLRLSVSDSGAEISVKDSGIGIPEDEIEMLFEPFYRSSNVEARSGTGLGLAICKQYSDAIGGRITVESVIQDGSTFTLILPLG